MSLKLGVVMDSLESINYKKDSTLAMMAAAQSRGWDIFTIQQSGLFVSEGAVLAKQVKISVNQAGPSWFEVQSELTGPVTDLDAVLMRKDPPFDMEYVYSTYLLEMAETEGTLVLNRPGSIRDCNEKLFALRFPQCCPPHIVSRDPQILRSFHENHEDVIFKPLDGMGGTSTERPAPGSPPRRSPRRCAA